VTALRYSAYHIMTRNFSDDEDPLITLFSVQLSTVSCSHS